MRSSAKVMSYIEEQVSAALAAASTTAADKAKSAALVYVQETSARAEERLQECFRAATTELQSRARSSSALSTGRMIV